MDISGYIANLSVASANARHSQSLGLSVARKAMDIMEIEAEALIQMAETAAPSFGHMMDIKV